MMIQGHQLSEIISAIFIILWGVIRYAGVAALVIGGIWLAMQSVFLILFLVVVTALATMKVKW